MISKNTSIADGGTEQQRRWNLSDEQVKDHERAGGVEGGMQAGSSDGSSNPEPKSKR